MAFLLSDSPGIRKRAGKYCSKHGGFAAHCSPSLSDRVNGTQPSADACRLRLATDRIGARGAVFHDARQPVTRPRGPGNHWIVHAGSRDLTDSQRCLAYAVLNIALLPLVTSAAWAD